MKELIVETANPGALDRTLQQLGGLIGQNPDGTYAADENGHYRVRAVNGSVDFLRFAMERQGYGRVIGESPAPEGRNDG